MNYENFVGAVELTCMPKEQMRKQWIDQMLTEYSENFEEWSEIIVCDKNRKIMVIHFEDAWCYHYGYGVAKCSASDEFDEKAGLAVAFAHFRGYAIPDFV